MAATTSFVLLISLYFGKIYLNIAMFSYFAFFLFLTCFILIFTLYAIFKSNKKDNCSENSSVTIQPFLVNDEEDTVQRLKQESSGRHDPEKLAHSLILEILPSNSPKWDTLFCNGNDFDMNPDDKIGPVHDEKKKRKKRAKKKKAEPIEEQKKQLVCLYPFTKSSSATQRKIKQSYDQLVKAHGSKGLTLNQIGRFVNCLVEARNELQHKFDVIKRRFTITKALLFKADRSSFDRIRQQIYKLELEQKRVEEDAFVYNWLQEQLKISPAYKKMLEIGAFMEMKEKSREVRESEDDAHLSNVTFEEFLAQEKKDAFWQRNGRFKQCSG